MWMDSEAVKRLQDRSAAGPIDCMPTHACPLMKWKGESACIPQEHAGGKAVNSSRRLLNVASNDKGQAAGGRNPAPVRRCHGVCCRAPPAVAGSRGAAGGMWQPPRATAGAGCTVHPLSSSDRALHGRK